MEKWPKKVIDLDELYYFYLDTIFIWKATKKKVGGSPADLVKKNHFHLKSFLMS